MYQDWWRVLKTNKREKTFSGRSEFLLGYKILLADDFVEGVQEFFVGIVSGNHWGGSTVWVQENVKTA